MFRYFALACSSDAATAAQVADAIATAATQAGWRPVLRTRSLRVFCIGMRTGINDAYRLSHGRGVVVGKLFRRSGPAPDAALFLENGAESSRIVSSEGKALVVDYWGRYVAFLASAEGRSLVLRDPTGALPCFHMHHDGVDMVFPWLEDALSVLPQHQWPRVSSDGLLAHLAYGELTGRRTALEGVSQVVPGELVSLGPTLSASRMLWRPVDEANRLTAISVREAADSVREVVRRCTQAWASCYDALLLRLSGGVDSSILLACLAEGETLSRVTALNYHSPGADSDERHFARLAAQRARRELIEMHRNSSVQLSTVLDVARTPAPVNYVGRLTSQTDADLARISSAKAMFTGGGGDQLFFEFRQWWPAADYLRLCGLGSGFAAAAMNAARLGRLSVWRTVGMAVADRFRRRPQLPDLLRQQTLLSPSARVRSAGPEGFLNPAMFEPASLPIGKLTQVQQLTYSAGYYDPYAQEAAPELLNPLLSQPVIELCLQIPTYVLTHRGRGRGLVRLAFAGDLPPEIVARRSKGGMERHVKAVLENNLDFAKAMLMDGTMMRAGLLDRNAVEIALSKDTVERPGRAGEIHMAIGVEAWLQRWPT